MSERPDMTPYKRLKTVAKLTSPLWAPWVIAIGTYRMALLIPGAVKVADWRLFSAVCFLIAGVTALVMIWRNNSTVFAKIGLSAIALPLFLYLALIISARSRCGDEPALIGSRAGPETTLSCAQ